MNKTAAVSNSSIRHSSLGIAVAWHEPRAELGGILTLLNSRLDKNLDKKKASHPFN
jgi:hypothetical protein